MLEERDTNESAQVLEETDTKESAEVLEETDTSESAQVWAELKKAFVFFAVSSRSRTHPHSFPTRLSYPSFPSMGCVTCVAQVW